MMGWIIFLIVGGVIGWLASIVMNRNASMGILMNVVVGIIGAFIGGWLGIQFGVSAGARDFSIPGLLMALVGAIILLAIVNLVQRGRVR